MAFENGLFSNLNSKKTEKKLFKFLKCSLQAKVEDLEARQAAVAGIANIANSKFQVHRPLDPRFSECFLVSTIFSLTLYLFPQDELMDSDVLGLLKPLLASKAPIMLRGAAQAVSNLALIEENRCVWFRRIFVDFVNFCNFFFFVSAAIMKKVLPEIVKLSESKDVRVQHCCAVALNNLAQVSLVQVMFIEFNVCY